MSCCPDNPSALSVAFATLHSSRPPHSCVTEHHHQPVLTEHRCRDPHTFHHFRLNIHICHRHLDICSDYCTKSRSTHLPYAALRNLHHYPQTPSSSSLTKINTYAYSSHSVSTVCLTLRCHHFKGVVSMVLKTALVNFSPTSCACHECRRKKSWPMF